MWNQSKVRSHWRIEKFLTQVWGTNLRTKIFEDWPVYGSVSSQRNSKHWISFHSETWCFYKIVYWFWNNHLKSCKLFSNHILVQIFYKNLHTNVNCIWMIVCDCVYILILVQIWICTCCIVYIMCSLYL